MILAAIDEGDRSAEALNAGGLVIAGALETGLPDTGAADIGAPILGVIVIIVPSSSAAPAIIITRHSFRFKIIASKNYQTTVLGYIDDDGVAIKTGDR